MHAYALDALEPFLKEGNKALDVGSGSGYLATCMAEMVGSIGKVVGIEHVPELVDYSHHAVENYKDSLLHHQLEFHGKLYGYFNGRMIFLGLCS